MGAPFFAAGGASIGPFPSPFSVSPVAAGRPATAEVSVRKLDDDETDIKRPTDAAGRAPGRVDCLDDVHISKCTAPGRGADAAGPFDSPAQSASRLIAVIAKTSNHPNHPSRTLTLRRFFPPHPWRRLLLPARRAAPRSPRTRTPGRAEASCGDRAIATDSTVSHPLASQPSSSSQNQSLNLKPQQQR